MPSFKTLVYSPDCEVLISTKTGIIDISRDLVGGNIQRSGDGVSFASLQLANKGRRYNNVLSRMDRVIIRMRRVKWITVFTGYLNSVPAITLYPGVVQITASCTLKRLKYTYWDPGLPASAALFDQVAANANNKAGANKDSGIGFMLQNILIKVGGWQEDQIIIQDFPTAFVDYLAKGAEKYKDTASEGLKKFKTMFDYDESTGTGTAGAATGPGGALAGANFTSIGPPANGTAYSDMEIVWIVTNAGWSGEDVVTGSSIIKAESGGNPASVSPPNNDGTIDRGLWQINSGHDNMLPGQNRLDPAVSTNIARMLYNGRGNWDDWSSLVYHHSAQQFMPGFRAIAASGGTAPPNSGTKSGGAPAPGAPPAPAPSNPGAPAPAPGATPPPGPTYTPTAGEAGQLGNGPTNTSMWIAVKTAFPNATLNAGMTDHANDGGYHPMGMAIDIGGDLQAIANWVYQNYRDTQQLIYINGPFLLSGKTGHLDPSDQAGIRAAYGESTVSQHGDHVHWASDHVVGPGGPGGAGGAPGTPGAPGTSAFQNKLAKNLFGYLFNPSDKYQGGVSQMFTGERSSLNDEPLMDTVNAVCRARMCKFQSAPTGEFLAYYPDYFGLDGTPAVVDLEDIELKNLRVDLNDDQMVTHMFTVGSYGYDGTTMPGDLAYLQSSGIATVEDAWLFDKLTKNSVVTPDIANPTEFLQRFGIRPLKEQYSSINGQSNPGLELLIAAQRFMQKWAEQTLTQVELSFMPELFPGMRINLVGHDISVYVNAVNHTFSYTSGFQTTASIMAPSRTSVDTSTGSLPTLTEGSGG